MTASLIFGLMFSVVSVETCKTAFGSSEQPDATAESLAAKYDKIRLQVGGKKIISMKDVRRISVSRRGIVHLLEGDDRDCIVTAMRAGIVAISLFQRGGQKKVLYVEVLAKDTKSSTSKIQNLETSNQIDLAAKEQYQAQVDVELLETQKMESMGGATDSQLVVDIVGQTIHPRIMSTFKSKDQNSRHRVLAKPTFIVQEDEESTLTAGGETVQDKLNEEGRTIPIWATYGMTLNLKLYAEQAEQVTANVVFELKSPSNTAHRYTLNQIKTTSRIRLRERILIGTIDLATDDQAADSDLFLSKFPIIGPLFRGQSTSQAKAMLQVWITAVNLSDKVPH